MSNWWDQDPVADSAPQTVNGLKAAPAEWGEGAYIYPNGKVARRGPRGGEVFLGEIPGASATTATPDVKEFQSKAAAQATLMDQALSDYNAARSEGYDPNGLRNTFASGIEAGLPWIGPWAADVLRDNPSERGRAAELQYTEGALRALTGAAATDPETRRTARNMFRQPGESAAVEPSKAAVRQRFADTTKRIAGPAYIPGSPPADAPRQPGFSKTMAKPQVEASMKYIGAKGKKGGTQENPFTPADETQYNNMPSGAWYIHPSGKLKVKP